MYKKSKICVHTFKKWNTSCLINIIIPSIQTSWPLQVFLDFLKHIMVFFVCLFLSCTFSLLVHRFCCWYFNVTVLMYLCNDTCDFINDILYNSTSICKAMSVDGGLCVFCLWPVIGQPTCCGTFITETTRCQWYALPDTHVTS